MSEVFDLAPIYCDESYYTVSETLFLVERNGEHFTCDRYNHLEDWRDCHYYEEYEDADGNKLWLGVNDIKKFIVPLDKVENPKTQFEKDGKIYQKFGNIGWFTNLENKKRNRELCLWKKYNPKDFPKYDNYDAINVDKVVEIPEDYDGVMGVPITFLDKYCPKQFTIIGNEYDLEIPKGRGYVNGKRMYSRIFIKRIS